MGDACRRPFNAAICEQSSSAVPAASPARHGYQAGVFKLMDLVLCQTHNINSMPGCFQPEN